MKRSMVFSVLLFVVLTFVAVAVADQDVIVDPNAAVTFATLPGGVPFPEGITANPETGDIYVSTFVFGPNNKLLRFNENGQFLAQMDFSGEPLLGLAFNRRDNKVYICNVGTLNGFGPSRIQRVDADFSDTTPVEDVAVIPGIGAPPDRTVGNPDGSTDRIIFGNFAPAPNALIFNNRGDLFVSDSFQGAVFRINRADRCGEPGSLCSVDTVAHDGLLATAGFPPFGANGLALNKSKLFIANSGDDRIVRLDMKVGVIDVFAESINGADGIAFDDEGILWVAANQADQVVALNANGRVIAELGEFLGIEEDGSARGLSFPASLVIVEDEIFVTNLALPLTGVAGDEPEEDVTSYTVSKIEIPDL